MRRSQKPVLLSKDSSSSSDLSKIEEKPCHVHLRLSINLLEVDSKLRRESFRMALNSPVSLSKRLSIFSGNIKNNKKNSLSSGNFSQKANAISEILSKNKKGFGIEINSHHSSIFPRRKIISTFGIKLNECMPEKKNKKKQKNISIYQKDKPRLLTALQKYQ